MNLGHQASKSEQLLLAQFARLHMVDVDEEVTIHHVTDTVRYLQLEVEFRNKGKCRFRRIQIT